MLAGVLADRFLAKEGKRAPELVRTLGALRASAVGLRTRWGVWKLWVARSVARNGAAPGAAVESECVFEPGARVLLVGLASLRVELAALLGASAALAERAALSPGLARDAAERYAVRAL